MLIGYICLANEPENFGIKESFPKNYVEQMIQPVVPRYGKKRKIISPHNAACPRPAFLALHNADKRTAFPKQVRDADESIGKCNATKATSGAGR